MTKFDLDVELGEAWYEGSPEAESRHIDEIIGVISRAVDKRFREGDGPARRDAHAFDTGCAQAIFRVDQELDPDLRHGVFAEPGREYKAWIRFSNSNFYPPGPRSPDARGMAIKLTCVPGAKLLDDEEMTQDFILVSHPTFFIDDLKRYRDTHEAYLRGGVWQQFFVASAKMRSVRSFLAALRVNARWITNPLFIRYWSMTPYRLGVDPYSKTAVKYAVIPCLEQKLPFGRWVTQFLRGFSPKTAMSDSLATAGTSFDFYVQRYVDSYRTPIETSMVEWKEAVSPLEHVAKIIIPPQQIMTAERDQLCENLSFNPWHSLPEHRPLGLVNRVRRQVYSSTSRLRHGLNKVAPREPRCVEG